MSENRSCTVRYKKRLLKSKIPTGGTHTCFKWDRCPRLERMETCKKDVEP